MMDRHPPPDPRRAEGSDSELALALSLLQARVPDLREIADLLGDIRSLIELHRAPCTAEPPWALSRHARTMNRVRALLHEALATLEEIAHAPSRPHVGHELLE